MDNSEAFGKEMVDNLNEIVKNTTNLMDSLPKLDGKAIEKLNPSDRKKIEDALIKSNMGESFEKLTQARQKLSETIKNM